MTTATVEVLGSTIAYWEAPGVDPPLVFLHGHGRTSDDWIGLAAGLTGRRMLAPDLIGYGRSDRPINAAYDLAFHRNHCLKFLDGVGAREAVLVGHSAGASIAASVAAEAAGRIMALVMFAPAGAPGSLKLPFPKSVFCRPGLPNRFATALASTGLGHWFLRNRLTRQTLGLSGSYDQRRLDELTTLNQPTLLIWSPADPICLSAYRSAYESRIERLDYVDAPMEAGHYMPVNHPEMSARLIREFLAKLNL